MAEVSTVSYAARAVDAGTELARIACATDALGPRTLSIFDLVAYADAVRLVEPGLTVLHPRIAERAASLPLAEIAPDFDIPASVA